jgi:hypothetical protein
MATLATLKGRVQQNLGEPLSTTGWFTPAYVTDWLNAGLEIVYLKMMGINPNFFGIKTTNFTYATGVQEYSLQSVNPFEVRFIEVQDNGTPFMLKEVGINARDAYPGPGEPQSFYWVVNYDGTDPFTKIGLVPTPGRNGAANNALVAYVARPRILVNDTDTPDLPTEFQELAIIWATILGLRSDKAPSNEWQAEFNFRLSNMLSFAARGRTGGAVYVNFQEEY